MSTTRLTKVDSDDYPDLNDIPLARQDAIEITFPEKEDEDPFIHSEGLNPCMGIILSGKVVTKKEKQENETLPFVVVFHTSGVSTEEEKKIAEDTSGDTTIKDFCNKNIQMMIRKIIDPDNYGEEKTDIINISLERSFLIRCVPSDEQNIQNKVATELKQVLSDFKKINLALQDQQLPPVDFTHYSSIIQEEKEQLDEHSNSNSIDFYLKYNNDEGIKVYYRENPPENLKLNDSPEEQELESKENKPDNSDEEPEEKEKKKIELTDEQSLDTPIKISPPASQTQRDQASSHALQSAGRFKRKKTEESTPEVNEDTSPDVNEDTSKKNPPTSPGYS